MVTANYNNHGAGITARSNTFATTATAGNSVKMEAFTAEFMMLQVQLMLAKDFSDQLQQVGEKIKFLSNVKKDIRAKISAVQEFQAKNTRTTQDKKFYDVSPSEMANLFSNFEIPHYNLDVADTTDLNVTWSTMTLDDNGINHKLDTELNADGQSYLQINDGKVKVSDIVTYAKEVEALAKTDPAGACELAKKAGISNDNSSLPIAYGKKNNTLDDGSPRLMVWQDSIDKMCDQLKNTLEDVNTDAEQLSTKLNLLTSQRKAALDSAQQIRQKMDEIRSNTVGKLDR